jgi:hypothetical protein
MRERPLNALTLLACTAGFLIYILLITNFIAPGGPRIAITVIVLASLGFSASMLMRGPLLAKLGMLIVVPVIHIAYEGLDPAKPTLNLLVGAVELGCIWIGAVLGHLVRRKEFPSTNQIAD